MTDAALKANQEESVIQPDGDITSARVPDLRAALRAAMADGAKYITMDLRNVVMVDSTGLGLLISAHNSLIRAGGRLRVTEASAEILELFRGMRLHQHFGVSGS